MKNLQILGGKNVQPSSITDQNTVSSHAFTFGGSPANVAPIYIKAVVEVLNSYLISQIVSHVHEE